MAAGQETYCTQITRKPKRASVFLFSGKEQCKEKEQSKEKKNKQYLLQAAQLMDVLMLCSKVILQPLFKVVQLLSR